jgi:hypothetical protein
MHNFKPCMSYRHVDGTPIEILATPLFQQLGAYALPTRYDARTCASILVCLCLTSPPHMVAAALALQPADESGAAVRRARMIGNLEQITHATNWNTVWVLGPSPPFSSGCTRLYMTEESEEWEMKTVIWYANVMGGVGGWAAARDVGAFWLVTAMWASKCNFGSLRMCGWCTTTSAMQHFQTFFSVVFNIF